LFHVQRGLALRPSGWLVQRGLVLCLAGACLGVCPARTCSKSNGSMEASAAFLAPFCCFVLTFWCLLLPSCCLSGAFRFRWLPRGARPPLRARYSMSYYVTIGSRISINISNYSYNHKYSYTYTSALPARPGGRGQRRRRQRDPASRRGVKAGVGRHYG